MHLPSLWPLLLGLTVGVAPLVAQGGGMGAPPGGMGGGRRPPMGARAAEMPSAGMLEGPYAPDSMIRKFGLDPVQGDRYRAAWDSMMAATRPRRDTVQQALGTLRRARSEGYQQEAQGQAGIIQKAGKELKKDEERFDKVIRKFLTDDQWDDFKDWRERRRETERELRAQQMRERGMGAPGGRRPPG